MKLPNITELVKSMASFERYQEGSLWYSIAWFERDESGVALKWHEEESAFHFPVPIDDVGTGSFGPREKGIYLMRWIRKHLEYLNAAQKDQDLHLALVVQELGGQRHE